MSKKNQYRATMHLLSMALFWLCRPKHSQQNFKRRRFLWSYCQSTDFTLTLEINPPLSYLTIFYHILHRINQQIESYCFFQFTRKYFISYWAPHQEYFSARAQGNNFFPSYIAYWHLLEQWETDNNNNKVILKTLNTT